LRRIMLQHTQVDIGIPLRLQIKDLWLEHNNSI
jgi:hypothetical protein